MVFSMLEPHVKDATVIDVGCGEGYCARKMVEMGAKKVIGSDISAGMIESAIQASKGDDRFTYFTKLLYRSRSEIAYYICRSKNL